MLHGVAKAPSLVSNKKLSSVGVETNMFARRDGISSLSVEENIIIPRYPYRSSSTGIGTRRLLREIFRDVTVMEVLDHRLSMAPAKAVPNPD